MNSFKQVIVNAVIKVSLDPNHVDIVYDTQEQARDAFVKALIAELFPESPEYMLPSTEQVSEVRSYKQHNDMHYAAATSAVRAEIRRGAPAAAGAGAEEAPVKEKKKRAPKKKEEAAPVEAPTSAPAEEKKDAPVEAPVEEKKKRAPKKAAPAAAGAGEAPVEEKKKRGPKPKVVEAAVNHPKKLNKTEENKVKSISKELKVETDDAKVLEYLNGLSAEEYAAKSFDEHVRAFLTPTVAVVEEKVAKRGLLVEFQGKDYWIDPETKKVYATTGSVDEHVGHVGMLEFAEMEIPPYDPNELDVIEN